MKHYAPQDLAKTFFLLVKESNSRVKAFMLRVLRDAEKSVPSLYWSLPCDIHVMTTILFSIMIVLLIIIV